MPEPTRTCRALGGDLTSASALGLSSPSVPDEEVFVVPRPTGPPADPRAVHKLLEPRARGKLKKDAKKAAADAGLPDSLVQHFGSLDSAHLQLLADTYNELHKAGLTHEFDDGASVAFF
jgi:hypothetical protein